MTKRAILIPPTARTGPAPTLYFAFGSNLDTAQMRARCRHAVVERRAVLHGYRLAFTGYSVLRGGGVATVIEAEGDAVEGLLYRLTDADLVELDKYEGHPGFYRRVRVTVEDARGAQVSAWTYRLDRAERRPAVEYTRIIADAYMTLGISLASLEAAYQRAPEHPPSTEIFVYGSLLRGQANHGVLRRHGARFVAAGKTEPRFTMYSLGEYPAIASHGKTAIAGEVYAVDADALAALDKFEGAQYRRVGVALDDGRHVDVYLLRGDVPAGAPKVRGGDWGRYLARRDKIAARAPGALDRGRRERDAIPVVSGLDRVHALAARPTLAPAAPIDRLPDDDRQGVLWNEAPALAAPAAPAPGTWSPDGSGGILFVDDRGRSQRYSVKGGSADDALRALRLSPPRKVTA